MCINNSFYFILQTAVKVETHSCRHAIKPNNKEKNQNPRCIPCTYFYVHPFCVYVNVCITSEYVYYVLSPNLKEKRNFLFCCIFFSLLSFIVLIFCLRVRTLTIKLEQRHSVFAQLRFDSTTRFAMDDEFICEVSHQMRFS